MGEPKLTILVDTREQKPYEFSGFVTKRATLQAGDYSIDGHADDVAVERKSKEDAYGCVGASRGRFTDCLRRLGAINRGAIVIEASLDDFSAPPRHTRITAAQAVGSYISWSCQYRIPVFWCPSRAYAERVVIRWLASYLKHLKTATPG